MRQDCAPAPGEDDDNPYQESDEALPPDSEEGAIRRDPTQRFQTAGELIAALGEVACIDWRHAEGSALDGRWESVHGAILVTRQPGRE